MHAKFSVDYIALPQHQKRVLTHHTDDPVELEEFLMNLLAGGARIKEIRHDGESLSRVQFDRMLKVASERMGAIMLQEARGIDAPEVRHRFGLPA